MKTWNRWAVMTLTLALVASPSFARHHKAKEAAKPVNCPVCKMALSDKKTDANPKSIKIGKKTMFCCAGCDMSSLEKKKK